jgi:PKD repeat protein
MPKSKRKTMKKVLIYFILFSCYTYPSFAIDRLVTITSIAENGGTILPNGEVSVIAGRNKSFVIKAQIGYEIAYLIIDGKMSKPQNLYTFSNITENHTIQAVFIAKKQFTIAAIAGENGSITPSGQVSVYEYDKQTFQIISERGYSINRLIVDDIDIKPQSEFTFWDVSDNHVIKVGFSPIKRFAIMAQSGAGGSIEPSGQVVIDEHSDQKFRIQANNGYMIKDVYIDYMGIGPKNEFQFRDITKNHIIYVEFSQVRRVKGRVIDFDTREGLADSIIEAWSSRNKHIMGSAMSDATGKYTLNNIPPIDDLILRCNPPSDMPLVMKIDIQNSTTINNDDSRVRMMDQFESQEPLSMNDPNSFLDPNIGPNIDPKIDPNGDPNTDPNIDPNIDPNTDPKDDPNKDPTQNEKKDEIIPVRQSKYPSQYYKNATSVETADILSTMDHGLTDINFALKAYDDIGFRGRVHDGYTGVENVMVTAFSAKHVFHKFAITDENGDYTINYLIPSDDYIVEAIFPDLKMKMYYSISKNQVVGVNSPTSSAILPNFATPITPSNPYLENIDLLFDAGAEISGHVYNHKGAPLRNIRVNAWSHVNKRGNSAVTDNDGCYTIRGLTEVFSTTSMTDGYIVEIQSNEYPYQVYDNQQDQRLATLVATGRTDVDFYLRDGFYISGQVRSSLGLALSRVTVFAHSNNTRTKKMTTTNEAGFYTFYGLTPSDDYNVAVYAPNYPVQFFNQQPSMNSADYVPILDKDAQKIDFILDQGATIQGEVKFENQMSHKMDAVVHVFSLSTKYAADIRVGMDGSFLAAGLDETVSDYVIMAEARGYPMAFYADNGDNNLENDTVYERNQAKGVAPSDKNFILILKAGYRISGSITATNIKLPRIHLIAWSESSERAYHTFAFMKDGNYKFEFIGLGSGTYHVMVDEKKYSSEKQSITIQDSDIENVQITLTEVQGYEISGFIYNLPQGETVSIHAWSLSMDSGNTIRVKGFGSGVRYRIKNLAPASDYRVELLSERYPTIIYDSQTSIKTANLIDLTRGDVKNINFTMDESSDNTFIIGTITFPVTAQVGEKVRINAHSKKKHMSTSTTISLESINPVPYTLMGLVQSDDIVLSIWPEKYPHQFYDQQERGDLATKIDTSDDSVDIINFTLDAGKTISGHAVDADGLSVVNARISIFSESTGSRSFALSDADGNFEISGLKPASDFILMAYSQSMGVFYYESDSSSVRNMVDATSLDLTSESLEVVMNLSEGYAISGTVQNISGNALENVRVEAWSDSQESGNSTFTDSDGTFVIQGLPSGMDYQVTARPDKHMSYQSQSRTNVETDTSDLQFILSSMETFSLSGTVMDSALSPVSGATVEVCLRSDLEDCAWNISDANGFYEISGLTESNEYQIDISPDVESSYAFRRIYPFVVISDSTKDITLSTGATISGVVLAESDDSPVCNVHVQVISESSGYYQEATSGIDGSYEFTQAPNMTDFEITASADTYIDQTLTDQVPSENIDFSMEAGGSITGQVTDASSGAYIEGAIIEIYSYANQNTVNYGGIAVTDDEGNYSVDQLKITDEAGDTIADYVVTGHAVGYPQQVQSGNMAGDSVNLYLYADSSEVIGLTITDASGMLTDTTNIILWVYDDSGFVGRQSVSSLTDFTVSGLSSDSQYQFLLTAYDDTTEILSQWASVDGTGVSSQEQAYTFTAGSTLNFVFQSPLKRSVRHISEKGPGPVRNLRSTTHDYRHINRRFRSSTDSGTSTVSNNPNITVSWDEPEEGEDDLNGYYTDFNTEDDYEHTTVNTVEKPLIRTRKITSADLAGDDVYYYFHVASVDVEGRVGSTTSISFRIDTVAPTNVNVIAPESTTDRNIALALGATGASDVYVSNVNYAESGSWDNLATEKEWKLTRGDGIKSIFVRFRDAAGNTSDTMTVTTYEEVIANSGPMISDRTFTITESLTDDLFIGQVEASDADNDPLTFAFETNAPEQGFELIYDSGLLFVDNADNFPAIPQTYDLTVTVQDPEEVATATVRVNVSVGNYPPEIANQSFTIDEHLSKGTTIGILDALDQDGDTLVYSISNGNDLSIFSLTSDTAVLSVASEELLDFETQPTHVLTVGVSDNQITSTAQITINLNNINDHAPSIQPASFQIQENPQNNALIGNLSVSDADGQTPVCSIQSGDASIAFAIANCQLFVNDPSVFDYETQPNQFNLEIMVSDGNFSNSSDITVNVMNINDMAPEFRSQTCTILENSPIDYKVYTLTATDPDNLSQLYFQFVDSPMDFPFQLDTETGSIRVSDQIDYEQKNNYTCTVAVSDSQYTTTALLTIQILNENDNAPVMEDHYFHIFENTSNGSIIGSITALDADGDILSYSLSGSNNTFQISENQSFQLIDNQLIETYEQGGVLMLTVSVFDSLYTTSSNIYVSITAVNDHKPEISNFQVDVAEDQKIGTHVLTALGTDADFDDLTYTFIDGVTQFSIDPRTAEITIASPLDFETQTSYTLTVQVWDGQFVDTGAVIIHVINTNDNPPTANDQVCSISENSPGETMVCQIEASDLDHNSLLYHIMNHTEVFDVTSDSGIIFVKNGELLDFEQIQSYTVQTAIMDGAYTIYQQSLIQIINENDNPPEIISQRIQTEEDQPLTTCIQLTDPDMDDLTLTIDTQGNLGHAALMDQYCLQYTPMTNLNGNDVIMLRAFDGIHETLSEAVQITITSVDDPPEFGTLPVISMVEDMLSNPVEIPIIDVDTPMSSIEIEIVSNNSDLIPNSSEHIRLTQVDAGYLLQIKPNDNASGSTELTIHVWDETSRITGSLTCTVQSQNDPPQIDAISPVVMDEDTISAPLSIFISDNETTFEALSLTVFSDNSDLIPNHTSNLNLSLSDGKWELIIMSDAHQFGQATITAIVNDGIQSNATDFLVTVNAVNDWPQISSIEDQFIEEDHPMGPIALDILDIETPIAELSTKLIWNNTDLIPESGMQLNWNNNTWEMLIQPAPNASGAAQLTVAVSDGEYTANTNFALTVAPINDPPTIQAVQNQHIEENGASGPIVLTVDDPESPLTELAISLTSNNPDLLPIDDEHASITSQSLFLTPVTFASGEAMITITVSDGFLQCQTAFLLEVSSVNQPPEISWIQDFSFDEDTAMSPISFTVIDIETPIESLNVRVQASNTTLFPQDNITLNYHDQTFGLVLSSPLHHNGASLITIYADDGIDESIQTFTVTVLPVEDPPELIPPMDLSLQEDAPTQRLKFMVSDPETAIADLTITAISDNLDLIPQDAIQLTGTTAERWLSISIASGQFGMAHITLTVTDESNYTASHQQTITVLRGNTLSFNGENDYVEIPDHESLHIENTMTAEVWIKTCTITSQKRQIINKINENGHGFSLALTGNNVLQCMAGSENQYITILSNTSIPANTWTHIAVSIDPQRMVLYINGQENAAKFHAISFNLSQESPLIFGGLSYNPTSNSYCGLIDDIRLWQVVRTQKQIDEYMHMRLQGNESGLLGYWHFKDNNANDHSASGQNHGVIHKDAPMISTIPDQYMSEDSQLTNIHFTVSDLQTLASELNVSASSSDENLLPQTNLILSGTDKHRYLTIMPSPNESGSCTITISVDDGETETLRSFHLNVAPVNDAPILSIASQIEVLEDCKGQSIAFQITDIDNDDVSINIQSSDINVLPLKNISIQSNDYLEITPTSNLSGSLVLTLTVSDGTLSDSKQISIHILPVNDMPEMTSISSTPQMEDASAIQLPFEIYDLETPANQLNVSFICASGGCGPYTQIQITGQGKKRFLEATPVPNQSGSTLLTIILMDADNASISQSLTLTVLQVNDAPEISSINDFAIDEDTIAHEILVQVMDIESPSSALQLTAVSTNSTLLPDENIQIMGSEVERTIVVTPVSNESGTTEIQLTVRDTDGSTRSQTFTITVDPVNDPPVIQCLEYLEIEEDAVAEGMKLTILDIDTRFEDLSFWVNATNTDLIASSDIEILVEKDNSRLKLSPIQDQFGESMIQIVVSDSQGLTSYCDLTLTVTPVNDVPEIEAIEDITINEDANPISIPLTVNDIETPVDQIQIDFALSDHSVLSRSDVQIFYENNQYTMQIQPKSNVNGSSQVCVSVQDAESLTATTCFAVHINPENDPPILSEFRTIVVNEDHPISPISFTVSDIETPSDQLIIDIDTSNTDLLNPDNYYIQGLSEQRELIINPSEHTWGSTWFAITVTDLNGAMISRSFLLDIHPVNDPPTIEKINGIVVDEDQAITPIVVHVGDIETSVQDLVPTITIQSQILSNDDISIAYIDHMNAYELNINTHPNTFGESTVIIEIADTGGLTDITSFVISQNPVNDPPTLLPISDHTFDEDCLPFTISITPDDLETSIESIQLDIRRNDQHILSTEEVFYNEGQFLLELACIPNAFGEEQIQVIASDAEGLTAMQTFSIEILAVNDPPIIQEMSNQVSLEDEILGPIPIQASDIDNDVNLLDLQVSIENQALISNYDVSLTQITIIPNNDASGSTRVTITARDPHGLTASSSFTWQILPVKDMPTVSAIEDVIMNEDTLNYQISFDYSHVDYPSNMLSVHLLSSNASIIDPEKQNITQSDLLISPEPDQWGDVQVCIQVSDPNPLTAVSCFHITIVAQNDAPTIQAQSSYSTNEDTGKTIYFTIDDIDSTILPSMITAQTDQNVDISEPRLLAESFAISLTPKEDYYGTSSLTINVNDNNGGIDDKTIAIQVLPINDAPVAIGEQWQSFEDVTIIKDLNASDVDNDTLTYTIDTQTQHGRMTLLNDHSVQYTPNANFYGLDRFSFYVSDGQAVSTSAFIDITVQNTPDMPVANAGNSLTINELQTVTLDASLSSDPDNDIASYSWMQIDGISVDLDNNNQKIVTFVPPDIADDQDLLFELTVTDQTGRKHTDTITVHVIDISAPIPGFSGTPVEGIVPLEVQFTDSSIGKVNTWEWEFGDGYISHEQHPLHVYTKSGEYSVILTIEGPNGIRTKEQTDYIYASPADIKADFSADLTRGVAPLTVKFNDLSEGEIEQMNWNFGDNTQSSDFSPEHTFDMPGSYTITLTIYGNEDFDQMQKTAYIQVDDRTISGTLYSSETPEQTLAGYIVIAYGPNFTLQSQSDAQGHYTIIGLPASSEIKLGVLPPSNDDRFLSQFYNQKDNLSEADYLSTESYDLSQVDFYLDPMPSLQMTGRVHDGEQGKKSLLVSSCSESIDWCVQATTDINGNYVLTGLKPASDYLLSVWWDAQQSLVYYALPENQIIGQDIPLSSQFEKSLARSIQMTDTDLYHMDIVLSMEQTIISGKISSTEGQGIGNIWVNAWSDVLNTGNGAFSDSLGNYTIIGLQSVSESEKGYTVRIQAYGGYQYPGRVIVPSRQIDFRISTTTWIAGKIESETGEPLNKACVNAWSLSDDANQIYTSCTDQNGKYMLSNLPYLSDYILQSTANNYPEQFYQNAKDPQNAIPVDLTNGPQDNMNFTMASGGSIFGQIFLQTSEQKASEGILINVWSPSAGTSYAVETLNDGTFEVNGLDKSQSDYYVMIDYDRYLPAYYCSSNSIHACIQKSDATGIMANGGHYTMVLQTGNYLCGNISGNVNESDNLTIKAIGENDGIHKTVEIDTDQTPNFCIQPLTFDKYNLEVYQGFQLIYSQDVLLIANKDDLSIHIEQVNNGQITGQIQGLPENQWAQLRVWSERLGFEKIVRILGTGNSVPYAISQLPRVNDYVAILSASDMIDLYYEQTYVFSQADRIDISSINRSNIDFTIDNNTASIWGTIYYQSENPFTGNTVITVWSQTTGLQYQKYLQTVSSHQINYSITGLQQASDYIVKVDAEGFDCQYFENAQKSGMAKKIDLQNETIKTDVHFYLQEGIQISGTISTNLSSLDLFVEIENQETGQIDSVSLENNYSYTFTGLLLDTPYILWLRHTSGQKWYYTKDELAYDSQGADILKLSPTENYAFHIPDNQGISGSVQSESGIPIAEMWIQASDPSGRISNGAFTDANGNFEIAHLPITSYVLTASPHSNSTYQEARKSNIVPGNQPVRFILQEQTGATLSGVITNSRQIPESMARIELLKENTQRIQTVSDISGKYTIHGLSMNETFSISVYPSKESNSAYWHGKVEMIETNQIFDISISEGIHMNGRIIEDDTDTGIYPASIMIESASTGYHTLARTDENGWFNCFNMPAVSDYLIRVIADNYQQLELNSQTAVQSRLFEMMPSGTLTGYVKDRQSGNGIEQAVVHIRSVSRGIEESAQTDRNGYYRLTGLTQFNEQGEIVSDYELTVIANNYPVYAIGNVQAGQERNIALFRSDETTLKGTINHSESVEWIVDIFEDQGDFVQSQLTQSNELFTCKGLDNNTQYQLRIGKTENEQYWIGSQGEFVQDRNQCASFSVPSQIEITATANPQTKRNKKNVSIPTPELRSTSHSIFTTEMPQVSNIPVIAMTWKVASSESIIGYYVTFHTQMDFEWQKSNTAGVKPVALNKLSSRAFSGDKVNIYCHIAAVDKMGNLSDTAHAGPYVIDTAPPQNVYIRAPSSTSNRNIFLQLFAQDATETYISTSGYDMGGIWKPYAQTQTFLLPESQGKHILYANFRDAANNITRASTAIHLSSPENNVPVAISETWLTKEDAQLSNTLSATDEDNDSLEYRIQTQTQHGMITLTDAYTGAFTYHPFDNFTGTDTFAFQVSDGISQSLPSQCTLTIVNQNDAPEISSQEFDVPANTSISEQLIATDIDNDPLTFEIVALPFKGTLYLNNPQTGDFQYIPASDATGSDSFMFSVRDQDIAAQPEIVRLNIISQESQDNWYTGLYPEGYIVDVTGKPLPDIEIIYTTASDKTYTQVTDENGYFVFATKTQPKPNYPLQALSNEYASISMPWPQSNPPETIAMLSLADAVLLTGRCLGLNDQDAALIQSEVATVRSVNGMYTLAVRESDLPVNLSVSAEGYNTVEMKDVAQGVDIYMEKDTEETSGDDDDDSGCFIEILSGK